MFRKFYGFGLGRPGMAVRRILWAVVLAASMAQVVRGQVIYSDNFTNSGTIKTPWTAFSGNWTETGGQMVGGLDTLSSYGFVYVTNSASNYTIQAQIEFLFHQRLRGRHRRIPNPATGLITRRGYFPRIRR